MKNNRELNNKDLVDVNGGSFTRNKYEEWVYHDAGMNTAYYNFKGDQFFFAMPNSQIRHLMNHDEANGHVEFYLNHTPEEYIKHVQEVVPEYSEIVKGHKMN